MSTKVDWERLIPELKEWDNPAPSSYGQDAAKWAGRTEKIDLFAECIARFDHLVAYMRLIWPEFVEHDDCVFLSDRVGEQNYQEWRKRLDKTQTEAMLNHTHIVDLCFNSEFKPNKEIILHIGRSLKEIWSVKLAHDFPNRRFTVSFPEDESDDLVRYEITFFQERHN